MIEQKEETRLREEDFRPRDLPEGGVFDAKCRIEGEMSQAR